MHYSLKHRPRQGRWRPDLWVKVSSTSVITDLAPFHFAIFLGIKQQRTSHRLIRYPWRHW